MIASMEDKLVYRRLIDEMVRACREGQGQISAQRARRGLWNPNAVIPEGLMADQHGMNVLLSKLNANDRGVIATMLEQEFVGGVHKTLVILHEAGVKPFDQADEGTPFHDFAGRLIGWEWPTAPDH
jgi:hypothetical protein